MWINTGEVLTSYCNLFDRQLTLKMMSYCGFIKCYEQVSDAIPVGEGGGVRRAVASVSYRRTLKALKQRLTQQNSYN